MKAQSRPIKSIVNILQLLTGGLVCLGSLSLSSRVLAQTSQEILPPTPELRLHADPDLWHFQMGVALRPYHVEGSHQLDPSLGTLNLGDTGSMAMPSFLIGFLAPQGSLAEFLTDWGVELNFGGSVQNLDTHSSQGARVTGTFSTQEVSLLPFYRFHWRSKNTLSTVARGELGVAQIRLDSSQSGATFTQQQVYTGYGLGLQWEPESHSIFEALYFERSGTAGSLDWSPAEAGLAVAYRYVW